MITSACLPRPPPDVPLQQRSRRSDSGTPQIAQVAAACGYADQAHLARDVRALGGVTPGELVGGNFVQDTAGAAA